VPNNPLAAPVSTRLVNQITNRMAKLRPGGNYLKTRGLLGKLAVPLITSSGRDKSGPAATVANNPYNPPVSPELTAKLNRLFGRQRPGKLADVKTAADRISGSFPAPLDEDGNRSPFSALKALPLAGSWISDAEKFPGRLPGGGGRLGAALPPADSSAVNPLRRPGDKPKSAKELPKHPGQINTAPPEPGKVPAPKVFTRITETMNRTRDQFKNMAVQATGDPDILKKPEKMQELINGLGQTGTPEGQAALLRNSSFGKEMETLGETWTGDKNFLFSGNGGGLSEDDLG
jgi:hypothetical protein